jgi:hypothetical protein
MREMLTELMSNGRYCYGMEVSPSIMCGEDMRALWDETNAIISMWVLHLCHVRVLRRNTNTSRCRSNDILSIKKEVVSIS